MKIIAISDTHGMFKDIVIPDGDLLIHAGDILGQGTLKELSEFNEWLGEQPHKYKIIIAGNHDWCFEKDEVTSRKILTNGIYLQDESITIDGFVFYGSPWQPWFLDWAFNLQRGLPLKQKWDLIPENVDILITHSPPQYILDLTNNNERAGCEELANAVKQIKPKFHVFGHIHEGYGKVLFDGCMYINASVNTEQYRPINQPIEFEV